MPEVTKQLNGATVTVTAPRLATPSSGAGSGLLGANALEKPPLLGARKKLEKAVTPRDGGRTHLGAQARVKGATTGDGPEPGPLTFAELEVLTDTARATVGREPAIDDERAP